MGEQQWLYFVPYLDMVRNTGLPCLIHNSEIPNPLEIESVFLGVWM